MPIETVDLPMKIAWWCSSSLGKRLPEGKIKMGLSENFGEHPQFPW